MLIQISARILLQILSSKIWTSPALPSVAQPALPGCGERPAPALRQPGAQSLARPSGVPHRILVSSPRRIPA